MGFVTGDSDRWKWQVEVTGDSDMWQVTMTGDISGEIT